MSRVLLVEKDPDLRLPLHDTLASGGHSVSCKETLTASLSELEKGAVDVVVSELSDDLGLPLLEQLSQAKAPPCPIVISSEACSAQCEEAERLGAIQVLHRPFSSDALLSAVRHAGDCEYGFRGRVHGVSLVDLLQMFHYARRSVSVGVSNRGWVHMSQGEVVHASFDEATGQDALRDILLLKSGSMVTEPLKKVTATISRSFQSLLLDALRACDESQREPQIEAAADDPFGFGDLLDSMSPPEIIESLKPPETPKGPSLPPMSHLLSAACAQLVAQVDFGMGAAVVDLDHTRILGMHWPFGDVEREDIIMGAQGMLQGSAMMTLQKALNPEEETSAHDLTEFRASSPFALHFAKRLERASAAVVLLVERTANPGLCWAELRRALPAIERALP